MTTPRAAAIEVAGMSKRYGTVVALDDVALSVPAGTFHVLLGENGAGKSTLARCMAGLETSDSGTLRVDGRAVQLVGPRGPGAHGVGMVHQHFTVVPALTVAENLVIARADVPAVIDWWAETERLEAFMARMPVRLPLTERVSELSSGEKQKLEILRQLYLDRRLLILDEPTSSLAPAEARDLLVQLKAMTRTGEITVLMITHKLEEMRAHADAVTVLRRGRRVGGGPAASLTSADLTRMMVGDVSLPVPGAHAPAANGEPLLNVRGLRVMRSDGAPAASGVDLDVRAGEIVGVVGVGGSGQRELLDALFGLRPFEGTISVRGELLRPGRSAFARHKLRGFPDEPIETAAVPHMSIAENLALRDFGWPPMSGGWWLSPERMRRRARQVLADWRIAAPSVDQPFATLSGGNRQRALLARELSGDADLLILANPTRGLDIAAAAEARQRLLRLRDRGVGVLLVSEDLDEVLALADHVVVMARGRIVHRCSVAANRHSIAQSMLDAPG